MGGRVLFSSIIIALILFGSITPQIAHANTGIIVGDTGSLEFDEIATDNPTTIKVGTDTYVIVYQGNNEDGILKTVNIFGNNGIISAVIESVTFDGGIKDPTIVQVDADTYAIAYQERDADRGELATIDITANGDISAATTEKFNLTPGAGKEGKTPFIIQVDANTFAIAYSDENDKGQLATIDISSTGDIAAAVTATLEFDDTKGETPFIIQVDANTFAIVYTGPDDDGFVKTVDIATDGTISVVTDTLEFDTAEAVTPVIVNVKDDIYAIAYEGTDDDGILKTIKITSTGDIDDTVGFAAGVIDRLVFESGEVEEPSIVQVSVDKYAIVYEDGNSKGILVTIFISSAGTFDRQISPFFGEGITDKLVFDSNRAEKPFIIKIDADTFAIVYQGLDSALDGNDDGFIITVFIGEIPPLPDSSAARQGDFLPPTLGLDQNDKRVVDYGFSYNGIRTQVEKFYTPFELITVNVGEQNIAELIIYEDKHESDLTHVALAFGLKEGQFFADSQAVIVWDRVWGGENEGQETVSQIDPHDVIDDDSLRIQSNSTQCRENVQSEHLCTKLEIFHTFRESLESNIVKTNVWDYKRNAWQNTFNHGIHIEGKSMNPPEKHIVMDKRNLITITEISKNTAIDENHNIWTFDKSWTKEFMPDHIVDDGVTMHLFDRNHPSFVSYKKGQELLASATLIQIDPKYYDQPFNEIHNIKLSPYTEIKEKDRIDEKLQKIITKEIVKAEKKYHELYDKLDRHQGK